MQIIENSKVKEKLYMEKLENGLTVMIIPKKGIQKKYIIWGTNYGSNDSTFIVPGETEITDCKFSVTSTLFFKPNFVSQAKYLAQKMVFDRRKYFRILSKSVFLK